jgi:hypothetical protein
MLDGNVFSYLKEDGSFYVWPVRTAYVDDDGDGYGSQVVCIDQPVCVPDNTDCDDRAHGADMFPGNADDGANIFPGATEIPGDGIDQDCDGSDPPCTDADSDNYYAEIGCGTEVDCDDSDDTIYPGATEILSDGIDQDCDPATCFISTIW